MPIKETHETHESPTMESPTLTARQVEAIERLADLLSEGGAVSIVQAPADAVIVIKLPGELHVSADQASNIRQTVAAAFRNERVLILQGGLELDIVRRRLKDNLDTLPRRCRILDGNGVRYRHVIECDSDTGEIRRFRTKDGKKTPYIETVWGKPPLRFEPIGEAEQTASPNGRPRYVPESTVAVECLKAEQEGRSHWDPGMPPGERTAE